MSLSTGSRRVSAKPLVPANMTSANDEIEPGLGEIDKSSSPLLGGTDTPKANTVRANHVWHLVAGRGAGSPASREAVPEAHHRRRLAAPLLDFVSALRGAISAFGQGQVGTRRELTQRQLAEIKSLLGCSLERSRTDATRILYVGDLSPQSGVVDLLSCVISWAERHRETPVDICWAGSGDLQGVLRAQSKPPNLTQSFTRPADAGTLAALAAHHGILAVPNAGTVDLVPIAQAMAAGLPVLGSARCPEVRMLVTSTATGWLFDPLSPAEMSGALNAALSTSAARLLEMRAAAQRRLGAMCDEWLGADDETTRRRNPTQFATSRPV